MLLCGVLWAAGGEDISSARIRADVKFLASDLLEGRGVGTRGGRLTTEYLATQFALMGAKPAGDAGSYFQRVPLMGVETEAGTTLAAQGRDRTVRLKWLTEFAGSAQRQTALVEFDGEAVFAGHGITAPEFRWDDYNGTDVRGKVVLLFANEPPSSDPKFFDGNALTYYGRWTYKFEEARRRGAAAAVLIHTRETAGYGWEVVRSSWGREETQVKLVRGAAGLAFAGWVSREAGEKLLALAGHSVDELQRLAESRGFRPIPLDFRLHGRIESKIREIETNNVAALVAGSSPELASQAVIFTAHWDHLGIGPEVNGDSIYNGAVDNATGCATLLEIARVWAGLEQKPRRSALFLAVTAEEGGLRGSQYYVARPLIPLRQTVAALNFDALPPFGRPRNVIVQGADLTTLWPLVQDAARRLGLRIQPEPHPELGGRFRSDHFPFAKAGVPTFSIKAGTEFAGKTAQESEEMLREYGQRYHQPSDELRDDWDFAGLEQVARFGLLIGLDAANQ